jgi:hypothetical protein
MYTIWRRWLDKGNKEIGTAVNAAFQVKSFIVSLWPRLPYARHSCPRDYGQLNTAETVETKQGSKTLLRVTAVLSLDGPRPAQVSCAAAFFCGGQCFTSQHMDRLSLSTFKCHFNQILEEGSTRWRSWLRHCATTSRKVAGSILDGVIGIFLLT